MIYFKDGVYEFCKYKVDYTHKNERTTKYVGAEGIDWWMAFESEWDDMTIHSMIDVVPTDEQKERFKEITEFGVKGGFASEIGQYVEFGTFPENDTAKVLTEFRLLKENKELKQALDIILGGTE